MTDEIRDLWDMPSESYEGVLLPVAKELYRRDEAIRLLKNRINHLESALQEVRNIACIQSSTYARDICDIVTDAIAHDTGGDDASDQA